MHQHHRQKKPNQIILFHKQKRCSEKQNTFEQPDEVESKCAESVLQCQNRHQLREESPRRRRTLKRIETQTKAARQSKRERHKLHPTRTPARKKQMTVFFIFCACILYLLTKTTSSTRDESRTTCLI
jgi:hypothetical protein